MRKYAIATLLLVALTSARLACQSVPLLTLTRNLTISSKVADLSKPGNVMVTSTGDILITEWDDKTIRVFSATGQPSTFGRAGEGPGEFRNLRMAGLVGDSVWVSDPALARITIFGPDHKYARSFRYPASVTNPAAPQEPVPEIEMLSPTWVYPDGTLHLNVGAVVRGPKPSWIVAADSDASIVIRTSQDGAFKKRLGAWYPTPKACLAPAGGGVFHLQTCAKPLTNTFDPAPDFVAVTATNLLGPNTEYHVTLTDANGITRISRDYPIAPVAVSKVSRDSALAAMEADVKHDPIAVGQLARIKWPVTYPPVRAIVVGRDGTLWLEERAKEAGHHWVVLDRAGNPIGRVSLPENVTLRVAELGAIWALETDADGLQGVVRYRVARKD